MLPLPVFEKVAQAAVLSEALLQYDDEETLRRKCALDNWIFKQAATISAGPIVNTLLKATAIAVPVTAGGVLLTNYASNKATEVANAAILKATLASLGITALGLGAYRLLSNTKKASAVPLTSAAVFKALKKLATVGMIDGLLDGDEKLAGLRQINRAYGAHILTQMLRG